MARKKVKLAWIVNDSARRATFKKRKKGLMKKVSELSTLCGVEACAIIYGPEDPQPDVWPSTPSEAHRVLTRFNSMPEMEQSKKMMNQEGLLRQGISKVKEQLKKQQKENRKFELTQLMYQTLEGKRLPDVETEVLHELKVVIEEKMKAIQERIDSLRGETSVPSQLINGTGAEMEIEAVQRQKWFMEAVLNNPPQEQHHQHQHQPIVYYGNGGDDQFANGIPYGDHGSWSNHFYT
ncbi:agamous-like MADS-box protein AGL80 [Thalictrum thalictroides]|uniref:Agamous-like MADS-box protein AGL80 n=2 Tax=Thalictrum thalictroides TaxID=46969 RepID=A0A7J6X045_THATH|nr:agamous-like MADS-box protein AGL80 [Thalictrum thalictroides]